MYESYNASYPLEYYSLGGVYSFIVGVEPSGKVKKDGTKEKPFSFASGFPISYPSAEEIEAFGSKLKNVDGAVKASENDSPAVLCGVVVAKIQGDGHHSKGDGKSSVDKLRVMFSNKDSQCGYIVKHFAVDYTSVDGDGVSNGVAAECVDYDYQLRPLSLSDDLNHVVEGVKSKSSKKSSGASGITDAEGKQKKSGVSGITDAEGKNKNSSASGITDAEGKKKNSGASGITDAEN